MVPTFQLRDVSTGSGEDRVLRSVTLDIECDGITVLAGRSGAGKTSLLRLLNRLDEPSAGTVAWNGDDLTTRDPIAVRRSVGMIFQQPAIFDGTALDNLRVAAPETTDQDAVAALAAVGLPVELVDRAADRLSGGEAQRLCFARALLMRPQVLLADEPTASLDHDSQVVIESLAERLAGEGTPMIWVSHDTQQLRRLATSVVVMDAGEVIAAGRLADLDEHADQRVRSAVAAP